jgi:hypothetical protein
MLNVILVSVPSCNAQAMVLLKVATISASELAGFVRFSCQARVDKANSTTLLSERIRRRNATFLRLWPSILLL